MRRYSRLFGIGLSAGLSGLIAMGCGGDDKPQPGEPPGDTGGGGAPNEGSCSAIAFSKPLAGAKLTASDDLDGDCANGVQYDLEIATSMPDGAEAVLSGLDAQHKATVSGGVAKFPNVTFPIGESSLTVQIGDDASCTASTKITASCGDAPTCVISAPVTSTTHPKLGSPDNVAAPGNPFQAKIEVTTNIEDGRLVPLLVDGKPYSNAIVSAGKAIWPGVALSPDGQRKVTATCTSKSDVRSSDTKTFTVDTAPPDLTIQGVSDGQHFAQADDADPSADDIQIRVCGTTNASDALDLKQGPHPKNFCVGIGTSSPECEKASASTNKGACVDVTCPGSAPFDIVATLYDDAGNATKKTIHGVTCASSSLSVQILEPVDGTGSDITTHILAANADQPRRDEDAAKAGAQYTVVACTDAEDGKGTLRVGLEGGALSAWNATPVDAVPAEPSDNCPVGLGYVLKFAGADLPESEVDAEGLLEKATRLVVDVARGSTQGKSPAVDVWVDSVAPTLTASSPDPLCGASHEGDASWTTDVELSSSARDVSFAVSSSGVEKAYPAAEYAGGKVKFENVTFEPGANHIVATATKPSGNTSSLASPCTVQVGNPPVITWLAPVSGKNLCAASNTSESCVPDADGGAAGWQGELKVRVEVDGSPAAAGTTVSFKWGSQDLSATTDENGVATLPSVSIDDNGGHGHVVALTASATAPGFGTGKATVSPIVDATPPQAPSDFAASVKDRRQTSFRLGWTASYDGEASAPAHSYDVRVSRETIAPSSFEAATKIPFAGTPASPGDADGIDVRDRYIETDYFFAVAATDSVGNRSEVVATSAPTRAKFNVTILTSPDASGQESFGYRTDGSGDLNGDGLSDLLVTPLFGNKAFAYFGKADFSAATPSIVFEGPEGFGASAIYAGDVDGDGREDIAISSFENKVYIFKGRASWPSTVNASEADYVIEAGAEYNGSGFGFPMARLGDFDGDGIDDFAVAAQFHDGDRGQVIIIRGSKTFGAVSLPAAVGTRAIVLEGDPAFPEGGFGTNLIGIGKFYGGTGNGIVVSAPFAATSEAGRVYAFQGGQTGTDGVISATEARHSFDGLGANTFAGITLAVVGPIGGSFGLAVGNPVHVGSGINGDAYGTEGSASTGPFSRVRAFTDSAATRINDRFGSTTLGGGFSGRNHYVSLIGDGTPDLVLGASREADAAARLYLFDGSKISALPNPADAATTADVIVPLPSGWAGTSSSDTLLQDVNGDSYPDIAITEYEMDLPGRVAIFW